MAKKNSRKPRNTRKAPAKTAAATPATETAAPAPKAKRTNIFAFIQQVRNEGAKVTWTSRSETLVSTLMVLVMVAFASIFFFLADQVLSFIVKQILNIG